MPFSTWLAFAVAAVLPLAALAEQAHPADAQANVPAYLYQSSFLQYRTAADDADAPDTLWISANRELAHQDTHSMHGAHPGQVNATTAGGAPAQAAGMHHGHHDHHREGH